MKTKKIVSKRFKITKKGLVMRRSQNLRHLRSHKSNSQIRKFRRNIKVTRSMAKTVKVFMPYA